MTELQPLLYLNIALSLIGIVLGIGVFLLLYKTLRETRQIEKELDINNVSESAYKSVTKKLRNSPNKRLQIDSVRGVRFCAVAALHILRKIVHHVHRD